jgi:chromosome segregation ATPase
MVSLEQVKLLESKVTRTIEYVKKVTAENSQLREKLGSCQKKIDELEVLIQRFKDDQNRIEDGILSALDRLNQFEDALESTLAGKESAAPPVRQREAKKDSPPEPPPPIDEEKNSETSGGELDIF